MNTENNLFPASQLQANTVLNFKSNFGDDNRLRFNLRVLGWKSEIKFIQIIGFNRQILNIKQYLGQ